MSRLRLSALIGLACFWAALPVAGRCESTTVLFDGDGLAQAFNIPEPITSFDTPDGVPARPRALDKPVRFRIPSSALKGHVQADGTAEVSFSGDAGKSQAGSCTLFVLKPVSKPPGGDYEFDVEIATWDIVNVPPSTIDPRDPKPTKTCGKFEVVDAGGTYHLNCTISNCAATVADFKRIFQPARIELVEIETTPSAEAALANESQVTGEETDFEAAPSRRARRARKPAAASAPTGMLGRGSAR